MLMGFQGDLEIDVIVPRGKGQGHLERLGSARVMRIPLPDAVVVGDENAAQAAFLERLQLHERALARQVEGAEYAAIFCGDLFSATAVASVSHAGPGRVGGSLVIEVTDVPSRSFATRWPVDPTDEALKSVWQQGERLALARAQRVIVPSRHAARALSSLVDARVLGVVHRFVDTRVFSPSSSSGERPGRPTVVFFGGREGGPRTLVVVAALQHLVRRRPDARYIVLGQPGAGNRLLIEGLGRRGLLEHVSLEDATTPEQTATTLRDADVVVVPAGDEGAAAGVPQRALEALAVGAAVVLGGDEAVYRDALQPGTHCLVVAVHEPARIVEAVTSLLEDSVLRETVSSVGRHHVVQTAGLAEHLPELAAVLANATGLPFRVHLTAVSSSGREAPQPPPGRMPAAEPVTDARIDLPDDWIAQAAPPTPGPLADRVKAALLHTQSGRAVPPGDPTPLTPLDTVVGPAPRSLAVGLHESGSSADDDWSHDTVADAGPMEQVAEGSGPTPMAMATAIVTGIGTGAATAPSHEVSPPDRRAPLASPLTTPSASLPHPTPAPGLRPSLLVEGTGDATSEDQDSS